MPVIGHGDLGPWNILARDSIPGAFIDWDNAGPADAVWELAQVAPLKAQLHGDDVPLLTLCPTLQYESGNVLRSSTDTNWRLEGKSGMSTK